MTDQKHAADLLWEAFKRLADAAPADLWPLIDDVSAAAQAHVEAVRLDERRAIVAWLRDRWADVVGGNFLHRSSIKAALVAIERGEHEASL